MMKRCALALLGLGLLVGCATASYEEDFLNKKVDGRTKAKVLVEAGTASFNKLMKSTQDVEPVDMVEEYFKVALRFDPENETASKMLKAIADYRNNKLKDSLAEAKRLYAKKDRKEEETITMLVAINRAALIDPKSAEVNRLLADTSKIRRELVGAKTAAAKATIAKAAKAATESARIDLLVSAWNQDAQALRAAPDDGEALAVRDGLAKDLGAIVDSRLAGADKLIAAQKYTNARTQIDSANTISLKIGGYAGAKIANARYKLYSSWANSLYAQKDFEAAETRAGQAYAIKRSPEMKKILTEIEDRRSQELAGASFTNNLAAVDKLIADKNLVDGLKQLKAMMATQTDPEKSAQLEARQKKILGSLPELYNAGVAAYRSEKFDLAVQNLGIVIAIDPEYEQASDFYEKAQAKKELLDQY